MSFDSNSQPFSQSYLEDVNAKLLAGEYHEVLDEASQLLPKAKTRLHKAACHFLIGAAHKELGNSDAALPHFLEATLAYPTDQPFLVGHAQLEVSEIQSEKGLNESALFFIDMAITNFDLIEEMPGTDKVKDECRNLKQKISIELNSSEIED